MIIYTLLNFKLFIIPKFILIQDIINSIMNILLIVVSLSIILLLLLLIIKIQG
jgi:hypothetical protein